MKKTRRSCVFGSFKTWFIASVWSGPDNFPDNFDLLKTDSSRKFCRLFVGMIFVNTSSFSAKSYGSGSSHSIISKTNSSEFRRLSCSNRALMFQ